jgi:hypothetical protein
MHIFAQILKILKRIFGAIRIREYIFIIFTFLLAIVNATLKFVYIKSNIIFFLSILLILPLYGIMHYYKISRFLQKIIEIAIGLPLFYYLFLKEDFMIILYSAIIIILIEIIIIAKKYYQRLII